MLRCAILCFLLLTRVNFVFSTEFLEHELNGQYHLVSLDTSWLSKHASTERGLHPTKLNTLSKHGVNQHIHQASMTFELKGKSYDVYMEKNVHLIPETYVEKLVDHSGQSSVRTQTHREHCWYHGHVEGFPSK